MKKITINFAIYLSFCGMILFALSLILDDANIVQKNAELAIEIKDKMNVCKTQDDNDNELLMSF